MGMKSSDDEEKIMRDHMISEWAKKKPRNPGSWDRPASEEERIRHDEEVKKWVEKFPGNKNPYDNERR